MNTHDEQPADSHDTDPDPHWWPRLIDRINTWWINREANGPALRDAASIPPRRAVVGILAGLAAALTLAITVLWWLISALVGLVADIAAAVADTGRGAAQSGADHLTTAELIRTITDPVHAYLTQHATGLPASSHTLWLTWLFATGALFLLATLGSRGARLGWILTGATTTAMVYAATAPTGRAVAAGLSVTCWALLSVVAFNRLATMPRPALELNLPTRRHRADDE